MGLMDKLDRHSTLMNRMGDTVNVDLAEAMADNKISGYELRNAVMACMGCEGSNTCPDWLKAHDKGAPDTPEYCRNQSLFERLKT